MSQVPRAKAKFYIFHFDTYILVCLIKPKSQVGVSYPPNLVHIFILSGFANKIKVLAVSEVRTNLTSSLAKNTKDFQNL